MMNQTLLVTGAGGFLGRHVVPELARAGWALRVLLRPGRPVPPWCQGPRLEAHPGDLDDPASLAAACRGVGTVVHLAARLNVPLETGQEKERLMEVNARGTARLLEACREAGVGEFVLLSSVAAMGDPPRGVVATETLPPAPDRVYGTSKLEAERAAGEARRTWGLKSVILRPVVVYGEGDRGNVARMLGAVARRRFVLLGGGTAAKSLVYAGNVAAAIRHVLPLSPPWEGKTYILVDEPPRTLADLARAMAAALGVAPPTLPMPAWPLLLAGTLLEGLSRPFGRRPLLSAHTVRKLTRDLLYSGEAFRSETGFRPPFALEEALARTATWYREEVQARGDTS